MHGSSQDRRVHFGDQLLCLFVQALVEIGLEFFCPANERAIVLVAQKIVENALSPHSYGRGGDVKVRIQQVDISAGSEVGNVENFSGKQLIQIPGASSKDSVGFILDPSIHLGPFKLREDRLVDAQIQGLVPEGEPELTDYSLGRLVDAWILLQDV